MSEWPRDELRRIAETDDLHIAPLREDGVTYGTPTWIWSVVVEDGLYVRAYSGPASSWYRAAIKQHTGRIIVAGMTKDVNSCPSKASITRISMKRTGRSTRTALTSNQWSENPPVPQP